MVKVSAHRDGFPLAQIGVRLGTLGEALGSTIILVSPDHVENHRTTEEQPCKPH